MSIDNNLIVFKTIANFTQALSGEFGKRQHSLSLYCRLINKTTLAHDIPIKKHVSIFTDFCITNRNAIINKDHSQIVKDLISYSDKVFINIKQIFGWADADTKAVIWTHLLTISALVDSSSGAKDILKENLDAKIPANEDFLSKLMEKIESNISPDATPMQAIASIMSSGVLTDLISGMNSGISDGSIDMAKLMGSVQAMVSKMAPKDGKGNEEAMNMINGLVGMMGGAGGGDGAPNIASMMQGLMGGAGGGDGAPNIASMMQGLMGSMMKPQESDSTISQIKEL